jgi:hypothetical protein
MREGIGRKRRRVTALLILLVAVGSSWAAPETDEVLLGRGETFFRLLKERNYGSLWAYLSKRSQETIVADTMKNLGGDSAVGGRREEITRDFAAGGSIARGYWSGFLAVFNPDAVLEESRWTTDTVKKESAVIVLRHKKGESPVYLRMVKEEGTWRVGLVETFWGK